LRTSEVRPARLLPSVSDDETPIGSLFVVGADDRTTVDPFTRSDPYHLDGVWETLAILAYRKKHWPMSIVDLRRLSRPARDDAYFFIVEFERSRDNKTDADTTINGATSESSKR
jgi:hypothetical protein